MSLTTNEKHSNYVEALKISIRGATPEGDTAAKTQEQLDVTWSDWARNTWNGALSNLSNAVPASVSDYLLPLFLSAEADPETSVHTRIPAPAAAATTLDNNVRVQVGDHTRPQVELHGSEKPPPADDKIYVADGDDNALGKHLQPASTPVAYYAVGAVAQAPAGHMPVQETIDPAAQGWHEMDLLAQPQNSNMQAATDTDPDASQRREGSASQRREGSPAAAGMPSQAYIRVGEGEGEGTVEDVAAALGRPEDRKSTKLALRNRSMLNVFRRLSISGSGIKKKNVRTRFLYF